METEILRCLLIQNCAAVAELPVPLILLAVSGSVQSFAASDNARLRSTEESAQLRCLSGTHLPFKFQRYFSAVLYQI